MASRSEEAKASRGARQVNFRVGRPLYEALDAIAREEGRSVAQAARRLMEEGLRRRTRVSGLDDELRAEEIAPLAQTGGAFDWLADEPDLYGATSGEPV